MEVMGGPTADGTFACEDKTLDNPRWRLITGFGSNAVFDGACWFVEVKSANATGDYRLSRVLSSQVPVYGSLANTGPEIFALFGLFGPQNPNVTVTRTQNVQFRHPRHPSPEHSVVIVQYL
jgi:hypothetical protein